MGFRFRKSISAGPLRINFSKSGVGASVGGKFFRYTKKAGGGTRSTFSIPGTGVSYVKDHSSKSATQSRNKAKNAVQTNYLEKNEQHSPDMGTNNAIELLLCILLGWMGAHRFYTHRNKTAILYLLTFGVLGIGWIGDIFITLLKFHPDTSASRSTRIKILSCTVALAIVFFFAGCSAIFSDAPTDQTSHTEPATTVATEEVTEPSTEAPTESPTEALTEPSTEAPTESPTEAPTESPTEAPVEDVTEAENESEGEMVWISENGGRYHSRSGCSNMKSPTQVTKDYAESIGLTPCKRCH